MIELYNLIIKDFGNGKKQAIFYSEHINEQKRKETVIQEEIKRFIEMRNHSPDSNLRELASKRLKDLYHELDQIEDTKLYPCELTDEQYLSWLERKENRQLKERLQNDKRDKKKIFDYARANEWHYFATFTFNPKVVDRTNYEDCRSKLSKWLNNFSQRQCDKKLKYLGVPELHEKLEENGKRAWHFHCLLSNVNENFLKVAVGEFDSSGRQIYRFYDNCYLGRTELTKVENTDRVSKYITKYVTKSLGIELFGKHRHIASKNLLKPKIEKYFIEKSEIDKYVDKSCIVWEQQKDYKILGSKKEMQIFEIEENEL